jgi:hypothetical protein
MRLAPGWLGCCLVADAAPCAVTPPQAAALHPPPAGWPAAGVQCGGASLPHLMLVVRAASCGLALLAGRQRRRRLAAGVTWYGLAVSRRAESSSVGR